MTTPIDWMQEMEKGLGLIKALDPISYEYNERELVYEVGKLKLYHYRSKHKKKIEPLLVVFATVNRPEILDLFPKKSFIQGLLKNGMDVYLLDWGYPDPADHTSFDDYVTVYLDKVVQFILQETQQANIHLLGICQGGLICLCYTLLSSSIKRLILISTPIDFHTPDHVVGQILKQIEVKNIIGLKGLVPGNWLTQFFINMRPFELIGKKYLHFVEHLDDQERTNHFLRVEKWLNDSPDQTGPSFMTLIEDFYQGNKLIKGKLLIKGKRIDLKKMNIPILNVMAKQDEIVPISASMVLKHYVEPKHYSECYFNSGHIGIYISEKVGESLPKTIAQWLIS